MRTVIIFIVLLPALVLAEDLSGHWVWVDNSDNQTFSVKIETSDTGSYTANYCAVGSSGARIDCSINGKNNFKFSLAKPFAFKTNYSSVAGEAVIGLKGSNLIWQVTKQPQGEHYAPKVARLTRFQ